jgi:acetylornithine/succinyldiaminopimelate/putrescine aminotransferase
MPVSAVIARKAIYKKMLGGLNCKSHSTTMGGNALGMAIGLKSLELIVENDLAHRARELGQTGLLKLQSLKYQYPKLIADVRGFGMLFALQFHPVVAPKWLAGQAALIAELSGILAFRALHMEGIQANFSLNALSTVRLSPALTMPNDLFADMFVKLEQFASHYPGSRKLLSKTPLAVLLGLARAAVFT